MPKAEVSAASLLKRGGAASHPPEPPPRLHRSESGSAASLTVDARVLEALPNALYRVELQTAARPRVTAHVAGAGGLLRVLPGEEVVVELMPYDLTRGRIVRKREGSK